MRLLHHRHHSARARSASVSLPTPSKLHIASSRHFLRQHVRITGNVVRCCRRVYAHYSPARGAERSSSHGQSISISMILPYDKFSHRNEYLQRKCDLARREKNSTEKPWFYDGYGYRARLVSAALCLLYVIMGRETFPWLKEFHSTLL